MDKELIMSGAIRILLIIGSLITLIYILRRVRKSQMSVSDTVFWLLFASALALLAIFPQIAYFLSEALGFMAPINFVMLFVIATLIFKIFSMSLEISNLKKRIAELTRNIGLHRNDERE